MQHIVSLWRMVVQSHQSQPSGIEAPPTRCHAGALAPRGLAAAPAFRLDQGHSRRAGTDARSGRRLACRVPAHTLEYRTWALKGMAFDLDYPPGATPLDADELANLEPASLISGHFWTFHFVALLALARSPYRSPRRTP